MSSKHVKKRQPKKSKSKSKSQTNSRQSPKKSKKKPKSQPKNMNKSSKFTRQTNHLKVSLNSSDINKDHKRSKSPLTPFTDWYKSHKKSKPRTRQRSQSNIFRTNSQPMPLKNRHKKEPLQKRQNSAKPSTPSEFKKHKSPQVKLSRKNDKITVEINAKYIKPKPNKFQSKTPQINKARKNQKKRRDAVHKIRTNPKKRTALKVHKTQPRSHSANPRKSKRRSFFGISYDKKQKMKSENDSKGRAKKRKKKSFKARFSPKYKAQNEINNDTQNESNHKQRSSLDKLRMTVKALREEIDDDTYEDSLSKNGMKFINARDSEDSVSLESRTKYTTIIKFKQRNTNQRHHKRGSSGIPNFFEKKLNFEFCKYLDEKARLFIAYFCRLYRLRISESLFQIISAFHVMPYDSGLICISSKDESKYGTVASVTYHSPFIQIPLTSMARILGVSEGISDDRLTALLEKDSMALQKQTSVPVRRQSVPPPPTRLFSKSFDQINKPGKKREFIVKTPVMSSGHSSSVEGSIHLPQSHSIYPYSADEDSVLCDDIETDTISELHSEEYTKIKKYKKKRTRKRGKKVTKKLSRSVTYDTHNKHKKKRKPKKNKNRNKMVESSVSEVSEETLSFEESEHGFPDVNYERSETPQLDFSLNKLNKIEETKSNTTFITNNETPNTITNDKTSELLTDYSPPPSPRGYRSDDTMTPTSRQISPTLTDFSEKKEFNISFSEQDMQVISHQNKVNQMKKEWIGVSAGVNGVGIAEWSLLSNPNVFECHNNGSNIPMTPTVGIGLGFGIGGFIDRTRGVCGVSLAPIYYRYGGSDRNERYYNKLDIYNLYTGDYIPECTTLPFNNLHHTSSCIVREGYKSTLVISGGQYYGQQMFDSNVQSMTYFYAPWIDSAYHHRISEYGLNENSSIDKHGIVSANERQSNSVSRRNSIDDASFVSNHKSNTPKKRLSLKDRTASHGQEMMPFSSITTRPSSRSITVTHSHRQRPSIKGSPKTSETIYEIPETETVKSEQKTTKMSGDCHWVSGPSMSTPRASHGCVSWDEHIVFCCGGIGTAGRRMSSVEMLRMDRLKQLSDLSKLRWHNCQSMSANKSNLVLIHWKPKTCLVSVGSGSKVVESYDPYKDTWKDLPPLNTHQVSSKSCRFYYDTTNQMNNNCLIFIKYRNGIVKSMEYLDERKKLKKWTVIKDKFVELFNAQISKNGTGNDSTYLKNIQTFCFA